jgi:hypothetical protein
MVPQPSIQEELMVKLKCLVLGAAVCAAAMLIMTDFSEARRGGGVRGGGGGFRGGSIGGGYGGGMGNRAHISHPIAGAGRPDLGRPGRPDLGRPGRPDIGRPGYPVGGYPGGYPGYGYAGYGAGLGYASYGYYDGYAGNSTTGYSDETVGDDDDAVAACARRFKSYDPVSRTYIRKGGIRAPCP